MDRVNKKKIKGHSKPTIKHHTRAIGVLKGKGVGESPKFARRKYKCKNKTSLRKKEEQYKREKYLAIFGGGKVENRRVRERVERKQ